MTKRRRTSAQVAIANKVKNATYLRRAKKLRATHAFGDLFSAKEGADFRKHPESWSPLLKARITKYAKELGPLIAGEWEIKRYFRPDHLASVIEASPQERRLPGQKAAIFPVDYKQKVKVSFDRKHRITVSRGGIEEQKLFFDMNALVRDPETEIARVLDSTDAQIFKIITGTNESKQGFTREALESELHRWIERYATDDPEKDISKFDEWMFGIIAYPKIRTMGRLVTRSIKHEKQVMVRQRKRLAAISRTKRAMTKADMRSIRAIGRKGRVK